MAVLQWNPDSGVYELREATITTLTDVEAMRGEAATPIGNAEIIVDGGRLAHVETEKQFRDAVLEDAGSPVEVQFLEQDGVLYPADFHSLNLATAYYNFEQARLYALARGLAPEKLRGAPFYYFPDVHLQGADPGRQVDNAGWFPLLRSFLLYPFDRLQEVPLAMNQGVVAHEYGHGIFHAEVFDGSWFPAYSVDWCPTGRCAQQAGYRMVGIIEEGFADAWAVGVTGDPRFTHHSLSMLGDSRDPDRFVRKRHCYSQSAYETELARTAPLSEADQDRYWSRRQYEVGTVLAGALYRAARDEGTSYDQVMDTLLRSYRASGSRSLGAVLESDRDGSIFGSFRIVARAVIDAAGDEPTRRALCAAWMDRLALTAAELEGLCDDVAANGECG